MFGIKHNECVGFESRWKVKKISSVNTTQTQFTVSEKSTNTVTNSSVEVQTIEDKPAKSTNETDMQKLAEWLSRIYPIVKRGIDDANTSQAFKGYRLQSDSVETSCKLLQSVNVTNNNGSGDKVRATRVSALTWNKTGKSIAISSNFEHKSWCYHTGFVAIYSLTRDDKIPESPRKKLYTDSCVTSLKFHPVLPAVIAASTFSGTLVVWNVQNEDGEDVLAEINAHEEPITQILWISDIDSAKSVLLASSSSDGLLKLWNFSSKSSSITLKTRYKVKSPVLGTSRREHYSETEERGVICFDFSKHVPDLFVVGIEGGLVVQCSVLGTSELKGSTKSEPLLDPVFKYYEPLEGEIASVSFSPNRGDMFMTRGTDAEIRIYIIGQAEPAQIIHLKNLLNDVTFIPHEDRLMCGCGKSGVLEIFRLTSGRPIENITTEKLRKCLLTTLAVNNNKPNIVAMGSLNGDLQLWNVPWRLFTNME